MSVKQDRTYARTAQDLERKYSFGKTFGDMLGLINESRDKVDSVESSLGDVTESVTTLRRDTEEIAAEVNTKVGDLTSKVETKLDAEGLTLEVEKVLANGVDSVSTKTGYEFGSNGLSIDKSGEEMSSLLNHTGLRVDRNDEAILTANNSGVDAMNLHAKTYLIVGSGDGRSRFEDYGIDRTGCFWVGG